MGHFWTPIWPKNGSNSKAVSQIDAFKNMIEVHRLYNGLNESITMIYRASVDVRRLTLAHHNFPLPDAKEEKYPWLMDILNETGVLHVPHSPFGIPEEAENEIKNGHKFYIRSGLAVQTKPRPNGKRLGWMIMNFQETMVFTPEMIDEMHKQVYRIEDAWVE